MFEVIFQGKVIAGEDAQKVRQNVGRMFKADEAKLNALFSGKTVVIKSGLDQETAQKYLLALKKAGAEAMIRSLEEKVSEPVGIPVPEVSEAAEEDEKKALNQLSSQQTTSGDRSPGQAQSEDAGGTSAGSTSIKDFSLAPTGSLMSEAKKEQVEAPNTDHLKVKPMEGYLVEPKPEEKVAVPDISHLKLEDE